MLELLFQGLIEWLYGLILEAWEFFFSVFSDILDVDFDYLKSHIPVIPEIMKVLLAVGWALLVGNLVFQAAKSMMTGLGFEGEDPKQLFTRSFVFAFLLVASPQICELGLSMTSRIITLLDAVDAVDMRLIGEGAFDGLAAEWLLIIVINIILMFKVLRLLLEIVERYFVLAFLTMCAPLAFGMGGSKNTTDIFTGWCRMFASMCFVMASNMIFFKVLLSLLGSVPSGLDVLLWITLVFAVVKVARKVDSIITRIGLNPALTGDGLGGHSLPGMLAYTVVRSMAGNVVRAAGKSTGKASGGSAGAKGAGGKPNFKGPAGAGASAGSVKGASPSEKAGTGGSSSAQQNTATHTSTSQTGAPQNGGQKWSPAGHPVDVSPDDNEAAAMEGATSIPRVNTQAQSSDTSGGTPDRRSSVPPGIVRSPSHVKQGGGAKVSGVSTSNANSSTSNSSRNTVVRPGQAASRPDMAGTDTGANVHIASDNGGSSQSGPAGNSLAAETRNAAGKGVMPQPGLAGANPATRGKAGTSQPGTAGTVGASNTRKTSVDGRAPRSGIAGTATGSKNRAATVKGAASRTGAAGNTAPGGKTPQPGAAGTVGASSEQSVHGGVQASGNGKAGTGATRFTNTPRAAHNQTVQNAVQSEQQSAVTLEGAKQTPAGGAGKTPPASGTGVPSGGTESRFTQRLAAAQPLQSGTGPQSGTAGTAPAAQSTQSGQTGKETHRGGAAGNGAPAPSSGRAPGTAPQEPRISHQAGTSSGERQTSRASARQDPRDTRSSSANDGEKRGASATATVRQERRPPVRNPLAMNGMATVQHPGTAGTAPPAARPARKDQPDTRPSKPEEAAPEVKEDPAKAKAVPDETEKKEDGGNE